MLKSLLHPIVSASSRLNSGGCQLSSPALLNRASCLEHAVNNREAKKSTAVQ